MSQPDPADLASSAIGVDSHGVEAYGVGSRAGGEPTVLAKLGDTVIDIHRLQAMGLLSVGGEATAEQGSVFRATSLNRFLALGSRTWQAVDEQLTEIVRTGVPPQAILPTAEMSLVLPIEVADFCDFYASEHHASNMGRILRPGSEPLPPAWRTVPLGYHGRSGTVVVSGTPIHRPMGIVAGTTGPVYCATSRLDVEVELGFVIGADSARCTPVRVEEALDHVFGVVILNDWSARDIQAFEYQPLGPFLGKSFATSISPWVVPIRALSAFRVDAGDQGDEVGAHLKCAQPRAFDISLELSINSTVVSRPNARYVHWSVEQLVAHLTSNGACVRTGDLVATGTISGPDKSTWGSLMELAWGGEHPLELNDGHKRAWLEDGDTATIRAWLVGEGRATKGHAGTDSGSSKERIFLGEVTGTVLAATPWS